MRVLVVESSARLRVRIVEALKADPAVDVIGQAVDGRAAIDLCRRLQPDVVTMDVMLPVVTGLAATQELMQTCPTPILIIAAAVDPDELANTLAALAAGAVDVLAKPRAAAADDQDWDRRLVATVKMVSRIQVITHLGPGSGASPRTGSLRPAPATPASRSSEPAVPASSSPSPEPAVPRMPFRPRPEPAKTAGTSDVTDVKRASRSTSDAFSVLAIGASTGGPAAVVTLLTGLPSSFDLPILLVLHVSDTFGVAIANWLRDVTGRRVRLAVHGEPLSLARGEVIMAPPGHHLALRRGLLTLNRDPERHSCRPSVDVLFESLAAECGSRVAACLLTGMGRDGAAGLLDVHRQGGLTIAQDEATSVVFGMPGEAVRLGAAQHVLPVERIGPLLDRLTRTEVEPK